jgi:predicted nucleic acid-binding protein
MEPSLLFSEISSIFFDTAPLIYFIEGHAEFGERIRKTIDFFQLSNRETYSSVITLTEVLPKPIQKGNMLLAEDFLRFFKPRKHFSIFQISREIAVEAGKLRGQYSFLKSMDALQIATALSVNADLFLTNDKKLLQIPVMKIWTMDNLT